jgi:hypothetical protein
MTRGNLLSVSEKLLLSAYDLEDKGKRPFSAEDLVVSAWRKYPDTFGLAGYKERDGNLSHPDSNRVFAEIMGSKPIRKRGFLTKVGKKMYQLTEAGRNEARLLLNNSTNSSTKKAALPREIEQELKRLFATKAVEKIKSNRINELTFFDACAFWGISPRSSAIEFEGRIANFKSIVESAQKAVQGKIASFEHGGYTFGSQDLETILKVHEVLLQKFGAEINVIKKRTDERKV